MQFVDLYSLMSHVRDIRRKIQNRYGRFFSITCSISTSILTFGIDYGGPIFVKESRRQNTKTVKVYLALCTCMAIKAVHIKIVSNLTPNAFLAALDRFVAQRGIPSDLCSDCGTNYVGAARQLKLLFNDELM